MPLLIITADQGLHGERREERGREGEREKGEEREGGRERVSEHVWCRRV